MAENLIAGSIRMSETQWKTCDEMAEKMKLRSRNEFIRDAVDFYTSAVREISHTCTGIGD